MKKSLVLTVVFISALIIMNGCETKVETPEYESYKSYYPLAVGKYITYKLDSTVVKPFGTGFETKTYTVKDVIEEQFTDNSNRATYKIVRYKLEGTRWVFNNIFTITPLQNSIELVENNLRYTKLINPVTEGKDWKGNSYLSYSPFFAYSDFKNWSYTYSKIKSPFAINNQAFNNTITVQSFDSILNKPFYNKIYSEYSKGYEVYAKDIGKVYQDILNWEYQVFTSFFNCKRIRCINNVCDTSAINCNLIRCDSIAKIQGNRIIGCDTVINKFYYEGYGVKLTMIDHN